MPGVIGERRDELEATTAGVPPAAPGAECAGAGLCGPTRLRRINDPGDVTRDADGTPSTLTLWIVTMTVAMVAPGDATCGREGLSSRRLWLFPLPYCQVLE